MNAQDLKNEINKALDEFTRLVQLFTDEQLNASQGENRWTAGELAQHVVLATQTWTPQQTKKADRPYDKYEDEIRQLFLNQEIKMQAPPFIIPEHKEYTLSEIVKELKWNKHAAAKSIDENDLTDIILDMELPGWGYLSRYEWFILMLYHTQRHTQQLHNMANSMHVAVTA